MKLTAKQWHEIKSKDRYNFVPDNVAKKAHAENIKNCQKAVKEYERTDRPLRILAVNGSNRTSNQCCANEVSNSKLFLDFSLTVVQDIDKNIEIDVVDLRDLVIDPCNSCLSTTSTLCGFPCDCHPLDDMQKLYPKLLRSDILFCSTGVNQSTMSTRLKAFCDRMISLDGGFFRSIDQFTGKGSDFKNRMMALSASNKIAYDQRLYGRVGGYFISSKDQNNHLPIVNHTKTKFDQLSYVEMTAQVLRNGMEDYGYFHAPKFYAGAAAIPDIDYMYDKQTLSLNKKALEEGKQVIVDAIKLAKKLKRNLPPFKTDRVNRT